MLPNEPGIELNEETIEEKETEFVTNEGATSLNEPVDVTVTYTLALTETDIAITKEATSIKKRVTASIAFAISITESVNATLHRRI